jgi:flagellar biogenesis protein FliO
VATTENAAAVTSSLLSFVIPVMVALLLLILCVWVVARLFKRITRRRPL